MAANASNRTEETLTPAQRYARSRPVRQGQSATWVYDAVRAGFREGLYSDDRALHEYDLMSFLNVTRKSVREALTRLTEEGILSRSPRLGTVPVGRAVHVTAADDVSEHVSGLDVPGQHRETVVSTQTVNASPFVASQLLVPETTPVRLDESYVTVSGQRFAVIMLYSRHGQLPADGMAGEGAYPDRLRAVGFHLTRIDSTFEAIRADEESAVKLGVAEGSPVLLRTLTLTATDGSQMLSIIRMRGDLTVVHTSRVGIDSIGRLW